IVTFSEVATDFADYADKTDTTVIRVIREIRGYLMEVAAAVAEDHLSGDQFSVIARDERNQSCKVFRLNSLLDCLIHHDAIKSLFGGVLSSSGSGHHTWRHGVDGYSFLAQFLSENARHSHHRTLTGHISHLSRIGEKIRARGDIDDSAGLAFLDQRVERLTH